jgi:hypothetical protein
LTQLASKYTHAKSVPYKNLCYIIKLIFHICGSLDFWDAKKKPIFKNILWFHFSTFSPFNFLLYFLLNRKWCKLPIEGDIVKEIPPRTTRCLYGRLKVKKVGCLFTTTNYPLRNAKNHETWNMKYFSRSQIFLNLGLDSFMRVNIPLVLGT